MPTTIDPAISPLPIRICDLKVDKSTLKLQSLAIIQIGHLPGRILRKSKAVFDNWALAYIADGAGTYQVNDGPVQRIGKGSLFFIWPGAAFNYGPDPGASWEEYYVSFVGERAEEWVRHRFVHLGEVLQVGVDPQWINKLQSLNALLESGIPANADRAALLLESLLFEFSLMSSQQSNGAKIDKIHSLIDALGHLVYEPIDDHDFAKKLSLSVSTLRRLVRLGTGYPLNEYMHRLKVSEAKKLLINSNASVKEIALSLRYTDVYYFSRLFSKYAGTSATGYRQTV